MRFLQAPDGRAHISLLHLKDAEVVERAGDSRLDLNYSPVAFDSLELHPELRIGGRQHHPSHDRLRFKTDRLFQQRTRALRLAPLERSPCLSQQLLKGTVDLESECGWNEHAQQSKAGKQRLE